MGRIRKSTGRSGADRTWPYTIHLDDEDLDNNVTHHARCQKAYEWLKQHIDPVKDQPFAWGSVFAFRDREDAVAFAKVWAPKRYGYA